MEELWQAIVHSVAKMPYLEKSLSWSSAHFLFGLFVFMILSYMRRLYILEVNLLSVVSFAIIFSHSEGCLSSCSQFPLLCKSFSV